MEVLYPRCAGLDIHKDTVVACARVVEQGEVKQEVHSFATTTGSLLQLCEWLSERGCTHVAMEATGVYWKPVWHVLEGTFQLVLGNAAHIKNVPGRKTDVNDAMWIADLLAHGLIRPSFVPERPVQELRGLTRTRKQLVREKAQHIQRIHKTLEDANLKIASVLSDIVGQSGRAILEKLIAGETRPEELVQVTSKRLKASLSTLLGALRGNVTAHHRFLLKLHLDQIKSLEAAIAAVDAEVGSAIEPFRAQAELLTTAPGISVTAAEVVISEIGVDMSRFATAGHLLSWATLCPRNDESAGKRRSTRLRKGSAWLKTTLVTAAWSATRTKNTYLRTQFFRLKARRGPKKAIMAVAASLLTAIYYMLRDSVPYQDLGPEHFDTVEKAKVVNRLMRRLRDLGVAVAVQDAAEKETA
jgi:transposase